MNSSKAIWVALIAVAVIAIGLSVSTLRSVGNLDSAVQALQSNFGGVTTGTAFPHGVSVGLQSTSPTNLANIHANTCSLIMPSYSIAASSSVPADCAITGLTSSYIINAWFATSSSNGAGWQVIQSSASSTAGFATFRIVNNTGATAIIPASIASTTKYWAFLTQ